MKKLPLAIYFWFLVALMTLRAGWDLSWVQIGLKLGFAKRTKELGAHHTGYRWATGIVNGMKVWWKVDMQGLENLSTPNQATIITANHQSMSDIWVLYFINRPFRWIAKDVLFYIPIIGWGMKMAGYISVKRNSRRSRSQALIDCEKALRSGANMLFFPEGTRSKDATLLPFKAGAFRLAQKLNIPIQPIVLDGAHKFLEKGTVWPGKATVRIRVLPLMQPKPEQTSEAFMRECRELMQNELNQLRKLTTDNS